MFCVKILFFKGWCQKIGWKGWKMQNKNNYNDNNNNNNNNNRHDWVGKVIHWEMCKKFKFDHTNKWYMHYPAPVLENDTHKLQWDFDIHTDHLISAKRPDLIIINNKKKRICKIAHFAVPADHRIKLKECEKKDKYLNLARELKKTW